ncbi:MAG: sugar phosphate isomerase/epimerase family protein [Planctomycetota bacterium]|jgi:sugar phosphate isomerase/epimerase
MMYLTGFADEAGKAIETQIKATQELGWTNIECRAAGSANLHDIPDDEFERVVAAVEAAGITINCFGSTIANWANQITDPFEKTIEVIERTIPRMKRLDCKLVRIMSYAVLKDRGPEDQMEEERFRRLREMLKMFQDEGITPVHENCMNYGGMGPVYTKRMLEAVPGLRLVFDTGNPVFTPDYIKGGDPMPRQSAWDFYSEVRDHIEYIHIKDGVWEADPSAESGEKCTFTFAGEGVGEVKKVMKDLLDGGYTGGVSIEPHIAAVFHDPSANSDEERLYNSYIQYGQKFMDLLREIGHGDKI